MTRWGQLFSDRRLELISATLLGLAAMMTSWSGYQSSRWGGTWSRDNARSGSLNQCVTKASAIAWQKRNIDLATYVGWLTAYADSNRVLAEFYERRFRPEFASAFNAWIELRPRYNPQAPSGPFAMPEYKIAEDSVAAECEREHGPMAASADQANTMTDYYTFATVIFAVVLFFAGATHNAKSRDVRLVLLGVAALALIIGIVYLTRLPVQPRAPLTSG